MRMRQHTWPDREEKIVQYILLQYTWHRNIVRKKSIIFICIIFHMADDNYCTINKTIQNSKLRVDIKSLLSNEISTRIVA